MAGPDQLADIGIKNEYQRNRRKYYLKNPMSLSSFIPHRNF